MHYASGSTLKEYMNAEDILLRYITHPQDRGNKQPDDRTRYTCKEMYSAINYPQQIRCPEQCCPYRIECEEDKPLAASEKCTRITIHYTHTEWYRPLGQLFLSFPSLMRKAVSPSSAMAQMVMRAKRNG